MKKIIVTHPKKLILLIIVLGGSFWWLKWVLFDKPPPVDLSKEYIAVVTETIFPNLDSVFTFQQLHLVNVNDFGETKVGLFWYRYPMWSTTSDTFIYVGKDGLYLAKVDDINSAELLLAGKISYPALSLDETKIAFVDKYILYILDINTGQVTQLTDSSILGTRPTWSPNGKQIAFVMIADSELSPLVPFIAVINADGTALTELTARNRSSFPQWSPDGNEIVIQNNGNIYVMNADGTKQRTLIGDGKSFLPMWSPDGRHILYTSQANEACGSPDYASPFCTNELRIMNADGTNVQSFRNGENQRFLYYAWLSGH